MKVMALGLGEVAPQAYDGMDGTESRGYVVGRPPTGSG